MSDVVGVPQDSLDSLRSVSVEIAPFDRVLVGDQQNAIVSGVVAYSECLHFP